MTFHQQVAAGIDLGSNTFRLLVAECTGKNFRIIAKKMVTVRLSRGLQESGMIQKESMLYAFDVLHSFRKILQQYSPDNIRVCGTEALRQARNNHDFLHKAAKVIGTKIEILNGAEEARLSLTGVQAGFHEPVAMPLLLVDVGGGSTELLFMHDATYRHITVESAGLGVVGLTENFFISQPPRIEPLDGLITETFGQVLANLNVKQGHAPVTIIGCGGTATSMAALDLNLSIYDESVVQGHVLQDTTVEKLWNKLFMLPPECRNKLPCLGEGRGEILPAGIRIYLLLLKLLQQDRLIVSDTGLLEGIMLSSMPQAADCSVNI